MNTLQTTIDLFPTAAPVSANSQAPSAALPETTTVGSCASTSVVKVPSWFTAGAAARVAQLKGVAHLLVVDRGAVVGTAARATLLAAPASEPLARIMSATVSVTPETSREEAWRLMALQGLDCLAVVSGPLLVGLVTREDLADEARAAG
jgi:CBS domain-containing protein